MLLLTLIEANNKIKAFMKKKIIISAGGRSAPLLPPGRKPAPSIPDHDVSGDSEQTTDNSSIPPSPKV